MAEPTKLTAAVAVSPPESARRRCRGQVRRFDDGRVVLVLAHSDGWIDDGDQSAACVLEATALRPPPGGDGHAWMRDTISAAERALRREQRLIGDGHVLSATIIVALLDASLVTLGWVGNASGFLVRGGAVCAATAPHNLSRLVRERGEDLDSLHLDSIVTKGLLGLEEAPAAEPELISWPVEAGDRVLLAPRAVAQALRETSTRVRWGLPLHTVADLLAHLGARGDDDVALVMAEFPERG